MAASARAGAASSTGAAVAARPVAVAAPRRLRPGRALTRSRVIRILSGIQACPTAACRRRPRATPAPGVVAKPRLEVNKGCNARINRLYPQRLLAPRLLALSEAEPKESRS